MCIVLCVACTLFLSFLTGAFVRKLYETEILTGVDRGCFLCKTMAVEDSGLGILNLHTGMMSILEEPRDKNSNGIDSGFTVMFSGEVGSTASIQPRGDSTVEVDIYLSENSLWESGVTKELLCEQCMEELLDPAMHMIEGETVKYDIAIVDFAGDMIYQIVKGPDACYVSDYFLQFEYFENRIDLIITYVSEN